MNIFDCTDDSFLLAPISRPAVSTSAPVTRLREGTAVFRVVENGTGADLGTLRISIATAGRRGVNDAARRAIAEARQDATAVFEGFVA